MSPSRKLKPLIKPRHALLSVADTDGLEKLARKLQKHGVKLTATSGTAQFLKSLGIKKVKLVPKVEGVPDIMDGKLKTMTHLVHCGFMVDRDNPDHLAIMKKRQLPVYDIVVVNMPDFDPRPKISGMDVGGPALLRHGIKYYQWITVVASPDGYRPLLLELENRKGRTSQSFRHEMACKAAETLQEYDNYIFGWMK